MAEHYVIAICGIVAISVGEISPGKIHRQMASHLYVGKCGTSS